MDIKIDFFAIGFKSTKLKLIEKCGFNLVGLINCQKIKVILQLKVKIIKMLKWNKVLILRIKIFSWISDLTNCTIF